MPEATAQSNATVHGRIDRSEMQKSDGAVHDDVHGRIDRSEKSAQGRPAVQTVHGRIDRSENVDKQGNK